MRTVALAGMLITAVSLSADTLTLKDGTNIEGRYLSSDSRNLQFEVKGKPFSYAVGFIREIRFSDHNGAATQPAPQSNWTGPRGKQQQAAFCQVLRDFVNEQLLPNKESNPIKRAQIKPPDPWAYEPLVAAVFGPNGEFADWTGKVFFQVSDNLVNVQFAPDCPPGTPPVTFMNGFALDTRTAARSTRIPLSSPMAEQLGNTPVGAECTVSGHLFARSNAGSGQGSDQNGSDPRQHFAGPHPGDLSNVTSPQFLVEFSQIRKTQP